MKKLLAVIAVVAALVGATADIASAAAIYQDGGATKAIGGKLITDDGRLELTVPADAYFLDTPIRIRYTPDQGNNLPPLPATSIWIGQPFTLQLSQRYFGAYLSLDKPMTMALRYNPAELGGRSEFTLRIVRYFTQWVSLPSTVDIVNHTVTVQVPYGGEYGLAADNVGVASGVPLAIAPAAPIVNPTPPTSSGITGRVFYDKNGNGAFDGDDFPIADAGLTISSGNWSADTRTAGDGSYAFGDLGAGTYIIQVKVGPEWEYTTPSSVSGIGVTGQVGSTGTADFGMWYKLWYRQP